MDEICAQRCGWADWFEAIPSWLRAVAVIACVATSVAAWSWASRRIRLAGQAAVGSGRQRGRDRALTLASMIPAGLFWLMVLGGSLHGLVAFGRSTLGWRDGWEYLVPGTLDGVSVTFAMLAFRAVRRGKPPDRCYRVVWGAALASATINYAHEYGQSGNALAGGYVALLSLFGMVMFDEFLNQFEQGAGTVRRENPKFGLRWLTWPSNTFLAAVAWRNHPPAEGTAGTVANAIANLNRVRASKRAARVRARPTAAPAVRPASKPASAPSQKTRDSEVKVPSTPATVQQWASVWIAMCQRPDLAWSALQHDEPARTHFGASSRQLRQIRHAVGTGALRRRAVDLSVGLPDTFDEAAGGRLLGEEPL